MVSVTMSIMIESKFIDVCLKNILGTKRKIQIGYGSIKEHYK